MRAKLILAVLACLSFSLIYDNALAEKREKKAGEKENASQQESWLRRGDVIRLPEDGEYAVKEGDTLWDISNSFLKDPFRWQNLWEKNQYIINPHLIYPGNKIRLFPHEPVEAGEKGKEAAPTVPEVPPVVKVVSSMMERHGLISAKEKEGIGVIIGAKEEKLLLSENDIVFIAVAKGTEIKQGDRFTVFTTTGEIKHPVTENPIGFMVDTLGILLVTQIDKDGVISAKIEKSYKEILKGAKLKPYEPPVKEVIVKKAEKAIDGLIIASLGGKVGMAERDIVYLDNGKSSGLEVGNAMDIFRPTITVDDPMSKEKKTITLPNKELGRLVVIAVEDDTATAFITNSRQVIYKVDRVRTAE